ncbi:MAG: homocysteine S-methyltransferase family protein [Candidatus Aureabacteria bacterium]|nr:homocysteine S-methyltransferase family protein [Candidatus Auribacterota bacterium]
MKHILEVLKERILLGDGAMGTMLQEGGLPEGACPEEAVLSRPTLIVSVHERYIDAGAEIIETDTFGANRFKLAEYHLADEVERINREAIRLAREASGGRAYVAGSVGPLGKQLAPLGSVAFGEAVDAFREQLRALARGGADLIFLETISDLREAKAALIAAAEVSDLPVVAHMTFGEGGRTLTGTPPEVAAAVLAAMGAAAVGANCSTGPDEILPIMESMASVTPAFLSVLPNAGLPELVGGKTVFHESPEVMARFAERFARLGVNIIGGCCGTTPAHIRAMASVLAKRKPVKRTVHPRLRLCSRTKMVSLEAGGSPLVIGERINLSVKKEMARAFITGDPAAMREAATDQVREGAHLLDVNVGVSGEALGLGKVSERELMERAVLLMQRSIDVPLVLDSNNPEALEAGLRESEGRPLINSVPADGEKTRRLLRLARRYGAAIVILPLSGRGIPDSAVERVRLAEEVRADALRAGIAPEDILIDPLAMAISAAPEQGLVTLETLSMLKERGYQTIVGLSNISFGLPERSILNASFLAMAMGAGLDAVILNPADEVVMRALRAGRVLTLSDGGARDYIARFRAGVAVPVPAERAPRPAPEMIKEKFLSLIVAGDREGVIPHVEEALRHGIPPIEINISMLAPALEEVGRRFERGELFLPQMILAAETVQNAFGRLRKEMKGEKMPSRGRIVMATVRGDVHDIGKNICCTVLENYGYEIIDLGRNVPAEVVVERAAAAGADIVGLSALMTTTMKQMELVIAELKKHGMKQRVMVGGAVVTAAYAKKIGAAGYAKNAGEIVRLVNRLMAKESEGKPPP